MSGYQCLASLFLLVSLTSLPRGCAESPVLAANGSASVRQMQGGQPIAGAWSHLLSNTASEEEDAQSELLPRAISTVPVPAQPESSWSSSDGVAAGFEQKRWAMGFGMGWCNDGGNTTAGYQNSPGTCFDACRSLLGAGLVAVDFWLHHNTSKENCFCRGACGCAGSVFCAFE
eukprot:COSAG05_NODE_5667_length_1119_cov_1.051961_1_plen_173_part_00